MMMRQGERERARGKNNIMEIKLQRKCTMTSHSLIAERKYELPYQHGN